MDVKRLNQLIDEHKDELFAQLCDLIKINSENFGTHGNEKECARYIHELCRELGLESDFYSPMELDGFAEHPDYFPGHGVEDRYNTVAVWKGKQDVNELMLMGHTDTVVIGDLANWSVDPLGGTIKDGKIYGRGACDDKYALATVLFLIKLLKKEGFEPKANLVFSAFCDEELGGSHGAMAAVVKYPSNRIVCMDGRENQVWNVASGGQVVNYNFHVTHAVDSAIRTAEALPIVIEELKKFGERRHAELEANRFYAGTNIPGTSLRFMEVRAGDNGADMGVGKVQVTFYTDKSREEIWAELHEMEKVLAERLAPMEIEGDGFTPFTRFFHYGFCEPDSKEITELLEASQEATGKQPLVCGSCLSDLSIVFKHGGPNSFAFGAGRGFDKTGGAHQPDEFIVCDDLVDYTKAIGAYILKVLG